MSGTQPSGTKKAGLRFGSLHLFYAVAVFAAALALFDNWGFLVAVCVLAFWIFDSATNVANELASGTAEFWNDMTSNWVGCLLLLLFVICGAGLMLPDVGSHGSNYQSSCRNNMRQLMLAMLNYESANGHFPPAYIADDDGKPMHSWRVLILPFLEGNHIYDQYDFSEPWDCLLYTSPSPRDRTRSRMPSSA